MSIHVLIDHFVIVFVVTGESHISPGEPMTTEQLTAPYKGMCIVSHCQCGLG